jgi:pilus assembly protein Flp/PilA
MKLAVSNFVYALRRSLSREDGQDLVEYALIVALIALAATAGMNVLATDLSNAFSNIGATITSSIG